MNKGSAMCVGNQGTLQRSTEPDQLRAWDSKELICSKADTTLNLRLDAAWIPQATIYQIKH